MYYKTKGLMHDISAGLVCGLDVIFKGVAVASLIYSGVASAYLTFGLGAALTTSIIVNLIFFFFGRYYFSLGSADVVIGAIIANFFLQISPHLNAKTLFPTLMAAITIIVFAIGFFSYLLGRLRLGQMVRFLPFPVINGIIAGSGWLVCLGALRIMSTFPFDPSHIVHWQLSNHYLWGLGFGIFFLILHYAKLFWLIPLMLLFTIILTHGFLHVAEMSLSTGIDLGWFTKPETPTLMITHFNGDLWHNIDCLVLFRYLSYFLTVPIISVLLLLLYVSSLEIITQQPAHFDEELRMQGLSNTIIGICSGVPSSLSPSSSVLNLNMGARSRVSTIVVILLCLFVLFGSSLVITYVPRPLIGGLLFYIGSTFIIQFLIRIWFYLPKLDAAMVGVIFFTIVFYGILAGALVGVLISCLVFIFTYARSNTIRQQFTRTVFGSRVRRSPSQENLLRSQGNRIQVFKLQGYLFFGSAKLILDKAKNIMNGLTEQRPCYFIFDFHQVVNVDSSAIYSLIQLKNLMKKEHSYLIFSHLSAYLNGNFQKMGLLNLTDECVKSLPSLDYSLEWCEEELLNQPMEPFKTPVESLLAPFFSQTQDKERFLEFLELSQFAAGEIIFRQGEEPNCLYFIVEGEISLVQESQKNEFRLSKISAGTTAGEMGFYLNTPRSITAKAATYCTVYRLTRARLKSLEQDVPHIAMQFHASLVKILSQRLIWANNEINMLEQ